jgi:quercetin dioxygenase-like cupin family protein
MRGLLLVVGVVLSFVPLVVSTQSPQSDVLMGMLELAPGATYPAHRHPAPELYYVMSGTAQWTDDHQ